MGNYSYLLKVILGMKTKIDDKKLVEELENIEDGYLYSLVGEDGSCPTNFEDYANRLDDKKLCGYLNNGTVKQLCKSGLCMSIENGENPIMYFDEEGWDRLHYFKFFPGTENVEHGSYAFDFDETYFEQKYKDLNEEFDEEKMYDYVIDKRKDYILNLINDKNIKWRITQLTYTDEDEAVEEDDQINLSTLMFLAGIRPEDMLREPAKYMGILKERFTRT